MKVAIAKAVTQQQERIDQLLTQSEGRFRRAIQNNLSQITDGRRFNRIERLIQSGQYEQALNESARIVAETTEAEFVRTYTTGGFEAADFVQGAIGLQVNFNQVNQRAINQLQQENLRLVTNFTQQQREASLQALQRGFQQGLNPRQTATAFRDSIGLTGNQERAVANYRRALEQNSARALEYNLRDHRFDSTTRRAIDSGQPLSQAEIDRNVQRYRERAIRHRSEVIARTESLRSLNMGLREGFQQQIDNGNLDRNQLKRRWVTARDERVRESHSPMHGQEKGWDEPFTTGAGVTLMHPGDPSAPGSETIQCRCIATTRIDPTREQSQQARSQAQAQARQQQPRRQRSQEVERRDRAREALEREGFSQTESLRAENRHLSANFSEKLGADDLETLQRLRADYRAPVLSTEEIARRNEIRPRQGRTRAPYKALTPLEASEIETARQGRRVMPFGPPPPAEEWGAINEYTGDGFRDMNRALRAEYRENGFAGVRSSLSQVAGPRRRSLTDSEIDFTTSRAAVRAMSRIEPARGTVFRGVDMTRSRRWQSEIARLTPGDTITEAAFNSGTSNRAFAQKWAATDLGPRGERRPVVFVYDNKTGVPINGVSQHQGESEILHAPLSRFRLLGTEIGDDGELVVYMNEVE